MLSFNLFGQKQSSVLGIDIGSSSIKVVQLAKKGGKAVLETYGELALGPYAATEIGRATNLTTEKISEAIKDLLREAKTTTVDCGVAIPFGSTLMTMMELPIVDEKDLATMIPLEARKYIPVPISEVSLDWWVIPKENENVFMVEEGGPQIQKKISVLVVAIHNEILAKYQEIISKTGLKPSFFEIEIFSVMRSVIEQSIAPVMIFDIGAAATKLYIIERGLIRTTHTINRGSQDITIALSKALGVTVEKAEILKRNVGLNEQIGDKSVREVISLVIEGIVSEAERVMMNYQKKFNKSISKVIVTGGGAELRHLQELAQNTFQTEVEFADPFSKVVTPAFLADVLKQAGPEFAVAMGAALRRLQELG